jgi:hypothetical protein
MSAFVFRVNKLAERVTGIKVSARAKLGKSMETLAVIHADTERKTATHEEKGNMPIVCRCTYLLPKMVELLFDPRGSQSVRC